MAIKNDAKRKNLFMLDPDELIIIGIDTAHTKWGPVETDIEHPQWDERIKLPVDADLSKNIEAFGVIQNVIGETDGDKYIVIDGRQRVRAARAAKKRQEAAGLVSVLVPVVFRRGVALDLYGVARSANGYRADDSIMLNARNAQRMIDMGDSEDHVATVFGVKVKTVRDWVSLLGLCQSVRKAIDAGEISPSAAMSLTELSRAEQEVHLEALRKEIGPGAKITGEKAAAKVRQVVGRKEIKTPKQKVADAMDLLIATYIKYTAGVQVRAADLDAISLALCGKTIGSAMADDATKPGLSDMDRAVAALPSEIDTSGVDAAVEQAVG